MVIRINNIEYSIQTASNLTCKQYIELYSKKNGFNVYDYISSCTGVDLTDIKRIKYNPKLIYTVKQLFSDFMYLNDFMSKENQNSDLIYKDNLIQRDELLYDSFGIVEIVSQKTKQTDNEAEILLYYLAGMICLYEFNEYDNDKTNQIYNELLNRKYAEVFAFIGFFLSSLTSGTKKKPSCLSMLKTIFITKLNKIKISTTYTITKGRKILGLQAS